MSMLKKLVGVENNLRGGPTPSSLCDATSPASGLGQWASGRGLFVCYHQFWSPDAEDDVGGADG
jgi:hypothetical protein